MQILESINQEQRARLGDLGAGAFFLVRGLEVVSKAASDSVSAEWSSNESVKLELPVDDKAVQSGETASLGFLGTL